MDNRQKLAERIVNYSIKAKPNEKVLVQYSDCDDDFQSMKLEKLGEKYVDPSAKFAGHEIKKLLERMKAERKKMVCNNYKLLTGEKSFKNAWETFSNRVRFITEYHECFNDYKEPTYYDAYLENPELVKAAEAEKRGKTMTEEHAMKELKEVKKPAANGIFGAVKLR